MVHILYVPCFWYPSWWHRILRTLKGTPPLQTAPQTPLKQISNFPPLSGSSLTSKSVQFDGRWLETIVRINCDLLAILMNQHLDKSVQHQKYTLNQRRIWSRHRKRWCPHCQYSLLLTESTPEQAAGTCLIALLLLSWLVIAIFSMIYYHRGRSPDLYKQHWHHDLSTSHCRLCPNHHLHKLPLSQSGHICGHQPTGHHHQYMVLKEAWLYT